MASRGPWPKFELTTRCYAVLSVLTVFQISQPGNSLWTHAAITVAVPYWSLSVALNIVITVAIVFRLLMARRFVGKSLGPEHAKTYTSVTMMIVESAALYSVALVVLIIFAAEHSGGMYTLLQLMPSIIVRWSVRWRVNLADYH